MKFQKMAGQALLIVLILSVGLCWPGICPAQAFPLTTAFTGDNHDGLYYGSAHGAGLTYVGRIEYGDYGSTEGYNGSYPETYILKMPSGAHLLLVDWNDLQLGGPNPQAWLGDFTLPWNRQLYANVNDWPYLVVTGHNPHALPYYQNIFNEVPPLSQVQYDLATGAWAFRNQSVTTPNGDWRNFGNQVKGGLIPGISHAANWLWQDNFEENSSSKNPYATFRAEEPVVPLLPTLILVGLSLIGLVLLGRRKFRKARR